MQAIVDTNVLIYAAKQKLDVYELLRIKDLDPVIPSCVLKELKSLCTAAKKGADKAAARLAAEIIEKNIKTIDIGTGHCDDLIAKYTKKRKIVVVTNDKAFKTKLKAIGVAAISISKSKQIR
jgi:rRNA-processing protein FCF1